MTLPVVLATGGFDHKIRLWDATSGTCPKLYRFGDSQVNCLSISNDKGYLAAGGNSQLQIFDLKSQRDGPLLVYEGHTDNVMSVGYRRDNSWIFSCSEDGTIKIWDKRAPSFQRSYDCGAAINSAVLHPNQAEVISGDQNGNVRIWDLTAHKCREEFCPEEETPIRSVSIAHNESFMTAGSHRGMLYIFNMKEGKFQLEKSFQAHSNYLLKCVISPDLVHVATTSADKTIRLWNTETWELTRSLSRHQRWVWDAVFSADSLYLVTASSDQSAKLWEVQTGEVMRNYIGHSLAVTCVALNDESQ